MKNTIIIGAGLAGLNAALTASKNNSKVILVSSMPSERAQSVMAEGGINAALNTKYEDDSTEEHYRDTVESGLYLADPNAVRALVDAAPGIVERLASLGVLFNLDDSGKIDLRNFGGQKKKRTAYAMSSSGKQIMTALIQEVRKYEAKGLITRYFNHSFISLIKDERNECIGCVVLDNVTQEFMTLQGDSVIIAAGGMNGLFGNTTGSLQNTGAVVAELFRLGVPVSNGEFIQYHPTTVKCSGKRLLISEAARGEGGRLFAYRGGKPWYFMEERYPEMGNLMPRDVVSREIWKICNEPDGPRNVFLDMTQLSTKVIEQKLIDLVEDCITYLHLDPRKEPIPVFPGIHYFMGGIQVDECHRTIHKNLYAAGECCCQYHGANRLGGNSLLGAIYGGIIAAESAVRDAIETVCTDHEYQIYAEQAMETVHQRIETLRGGTRHFPIPVIQTELNRILCKSLGIIRDEQNMEAGLEALDQLIADKVIDNYDNTSVLYENLGIENLCILGKAILKGALSRKESRGAHTRNDFPARNDELYKKHTIVQYDGKDISVWLGDIPQKR